MSPEKDPDELEHVEGLDRVMPEGDSSDVLDVRAKEANDVEHSQTPWQAIKSYPMAIFWSFMVSLCVIMEGYDTILIGNFYAYPSFAKKYGQYVDASGQHQLSAAWQSGLGQAANVGSVIGVFLDGWLVSSFGQKPVILGSLVSMTALVFIIFFAPNVAVLTVGELLCGIPWGIFAASAPAYASEVLPLSLRVYMTSYTNMCFIIGQLIAAGVLVGLVGWDSPWSYRIPFALQWVWPIILIPTLFFAPESPWHLVRKGKYEEAEKSLRRLQKESAPVDVKDTLANIIHTNQLEEQLTAGTTYWDCFRGTELRRTMIACMAFSGQTFTGLNFAYNSTYFFQQVNLGTDVTYKLNVGSSALALAATFGNWYLMLYVGRRAIYVWSCFVMTLILFVIGILNVWTDQHSIALTQAVLTLVWTVVFQLSVGQLGWALPAEIGSTRLRQKTVCLACNAYYVTSIVGGVLQQYFMNPAAWNAKGYVGFFWGGLSFITFVWAFFCLPETKGRSFEEIDWLFAKKTPTRKFTSTQIDVFDENVAKITDA